MNWNMVMVGVLSYTNDYKCYKYMKLLNKIKGVVL